MFASSFRRFLRSWRIKSPQSSTIRYTINNHWPNKTFVNHKILKMGNANNTTNMGRSYLWSTFHSCWGSSTSCRDLGIVILSVMLSHTIHVVRYIYLHEWLILMVFMQVNIPVPWILWVCDAMWFCIFILWIKDMVRPYLFQKLFSCWWRSFFQGCKTAKIDI